MKTTNKKTNIDRQKVLRLIRKCLKIFDPDEERREAWFKKEAEREAKRRAKVEKRLQVLRARRERILRRMAKLAQ